MNDVTDGAGRAGLRDRHTLHEVGQVVRALEANGPRTAEELAVLVGAAYWERNRYHRAIELMVGDGLLSRDARGVMRVRE